jgi:trehalose 6-phosphate phosphatase
VPGRPDDEHDLDAHDDLDHLHDLDDLLAPLRATPARAGILTDFDGTLSEIVEHPEDARPLDGVVEVLSDLAARYGRVAVISGRPVEFLAAHLPGPLLLSGLYGLQVIQAGRREDDPAALEWGAAVDDVALAASETGPAGMRVESKGLSLTLHFRGRPEIGDEVRAWATEQAVRTGLELRAAKMSFELHPPVEADKGTAVAAMAEGLEAVCFLGDDVGDLPAFEALGRLRADGVYALRLAVRSGEAPPELLAQADAVLDGPRAALAVLRRLAAAAT